MENVDTSNQKLKSCMLNTFGTTLNKKKPFLILSEEKDIYSKG